VAGSLGPGRTAAEPARLVDQNSTGHQ
jgi:hypothetical protein